MAAEAAVGAARAAAVGEARPQAATVEEARQRAAAEPLRQELAEARRPLEEPEPPGVPVQALQEEAPAQEVRPEARRLLPGSEESSGRSRPTATGRRCPLRTWDIPDTRVERRSRI